MIKLSDIALIHINQQIDRLQADIELYKKTIEKLKECADMIIKEQEMKGKK